MNDDSASDLTFSSTSAMTTPENPQANGNNEILKKNPFKKSVKLSQIASHTSQSSFASSTASKQIIRELNKHESIQFGQRIEEQYQAFEMSEKKYCYYIEDSKAGSYAKSELKKAVDGTYFLRLASKNEQYSNILYVLCLISHNETVDIPICYNVDRRTFYFFTSFGLGSEVKIEYNGIDSMLSDKEQSPFIGLPYPFKICLYRPITLYTRDCIPLPDELRTLDREDNILHELASKGLVRYFKHLILISQNSGDPLRGKVEYILNKINARNKQGLTPLILAIQGKRKDFIDMLIENDADLNIVDGHGCSPIQHACQQANYEILSKLINSGANPHYFNPKETTDGKYQSNLSALHYLAKATNATVGDIHKCAKLLLISGCPLMPLTKDGKSPFDIAQMHKNTAYECVKVFAGIDQFYSLLPIEVSSRSEAKSMLSDYTGVNLLGKLMLRLKQDDNRDDSKYTGLFLFYKTKKTRNQPDEEYGLCVYYNKKVTAYPITEEHVASIVDSSKDPDESFYCYSLKTDTTKDDHIQVTVFSSYDELIYHHTNYKGILSTKLTNYIRKEHGEWKQTEANDLKIRDFGIDPIPDPPEEPGIDVRLIEGITLSTIRSARTIFENHRRLIWSARVELNDNTSFEIIIKDYLPKHNINTYTSNRLKELNSSLGDDHNQIEVEGEYEYSTRSRYEYKYESKFLLSDLQHHPFIIHAFYCNRRVQKDLRIFMEYLPIGNLHSYLGQLDPKSNEPLINVFHWIYQLAQVMAYLAKNKIVHRDLATRNILLRNEQHITLSDFGLSRTENKELKGKECIVSPCWAAPECFAREQKVSSSSDVWSFGVVIWEIFSFGTKPYEKETNINEDTPSQQIVSILKQFLIEQGRRLIKPESCSAGMYDLMCRCWNGDANKRPSFIEIVDELNANSMMKDRLKSFTKKENRAWRNAKAEYDSIYDQFQSLFPKNTDDGYVESAAL